MALKPSTRYPAQTNAAAGYPHGKARNAGSFQDGTGTPFEQDWVNDLFGLEQSLLAEAGITPTGNPDQVGASQYLSAVQSIAGKAATVRQFLYAWGVVYCDATPAAVPGLGVVFDSTTLLTQFCKGGANGSYVLSDDMCAASFGTIGSLGYSSDAARDPITGNIVVVNNGVGGNIAYSTVFGGGFTDSASGVPRDSVVWDPTHNLFLSTLWANATLYTSPTGATWTSRALTVANRGGVAVLSTGRGCSPNGSAASINFNTSTNGTTWTASGGTLPDVANAVGSIGNVVALGTTFYAATFFTGAQLRIHSSTNASTWALVSTITPPAGATGNPVMLVDSYAGVLYVVCLTSGGWFVYASLDSGVTWFGPARVASNTTSIKAAGGRLWASDGSVVRCTVNRLPAAA